MCFNRGQRVKTLLVRKLPGSAYLIKLPEKSIYLYPGLQYGYIDGHFVHLGQNLLKVQFPHTFELDVVESQANPIRFDPSTTSRISTHPLQEDPYETIHVYVGQSRIGPEAGEGLFARKNLHKGQLVCLFNGVRRIKEGRAPKAIDARSEEWSDYRLCLGWYFSHTGPKHDKKLSDIFLLTARN